MIVFLICREYWRDRDEVNFRKLEFWTKLDERKRKNRKRERVYQKVTLGDLSFF